MLNTRPFGSWLNGEVLRYWTFCILPAHSLRATQTSKVPNIMAQYHTKREYRQHRVHYFGAILPILSVLGYWAIIVGMLEVYDPNMVNMDIDVIFTGQLVLEVCLAQA